MKTTALESSHRQHQTEDEFIARGLRAAEQAQREQSHVSVEAVMAELGQKLTLSKQRQEKRDNRFCTPPAMGEMPLSNQK